MVEVFAKPAVGAIIEKIGNNKRYILIQDRNKDNAAIETGMIEIPAGKIREYENIFDALRREVWEETGLNITEIVGEKDKIVSVDDGYETISYIPFCCTQNLSGGYSIILQTFICRAEGEVLKQTNETINIRWELLSNIESLLERNPEKFYPMHINALHKYINKNHTK
ncbi:NUDIX domain-containing protein [Clostridium sp. OS1-26]|uniref:NUDIX hydrolase n=1 Tax=Clostridium sp. OS1-26 TaxID=3070681 RepID=UPI0027E00B7D|nr:NUDIX domain-containing protein [Clostridium sp. OS1-26]WML33201.1 NUDIX domain-containing protein [Clostridium sp. OS1-26]